MHKSSSCTTHVNSVCILCFVGPRPLTPSPTYLKSQSIPAALNTQSQPRQRFSSALRAPQPRATGSVPPRTPVVVARPRSARPPTGIARPTVISPTTSKALVPRLAVQPTGRHFAGPGKFAVRPSPVQNVGMALEAQAAFRGSDAVPVPRRSMAPSRIAAIMMRRQYSANAVTNNTSMPFNSRSFFVVYVQVFHDMYTVSQKTDTLLVLITLQIVYRILKIFYC